MHRRTGKQTARVAPFAWALAALLAVPATGFAQDEGEGEAATDEAATDEAAAEDDEPAVEVGSGPGEFPRISDDEETIYALQRKAFLLKGRLEGTLMASGLVGDRFVTAAAPSLNLVYHLSENLGIELYATYIFPTESGLTNEILDKLQLRGDISKLTQMLWATTIGFQWSPIYGKLQVLGEYLGNYNIYLAVGAGLGETRVQCINQRPLDPNRGFGQDAVCNPGGEASGDDDTTVYYEPNTLRPMANFAIGLRVQLLPWLALKFDVRDFIFVARVYRPSEEPSLADSVRNNFYVSAGVSFLFFGEDN